MTSKHADQQKEMIYLLGVLTLICFALSGLEYYILLIQKVPEGMFWERITPYLYKYRIGLRYLPLLMYSLLVFSYFQTQEQKKILRPWQLAGGIVSLCVLIIVYFLDRLPLYEYLFPTTIFLFIGATPLWVIPISSSKLSRIPNPKRRVKTKFGFNLRLKDGWVNLANPFRGTLVIGAAGSGKSYSVGEPIIQQAIEKNYSGIVYDFKFPTLTHTVYDAMQSRDKKPIYTGKKRPVIKSVSFTDLSRSYRINPLKAENLPIMAYAKEFALSLISNLMPESIQKKDFWTRSAIAILTATIWYMKKNHPRYCSLPHIVSLLCNKNFDKLIALLDEDVETAGTISALSVALEKDADSQISGMMGTLQIILSDLNSPEIFWVLSGDDFSMDLNDPESPVFLCIGTSPSLADSLAPVVSLIITVCLKLMNQQNKHHSLVLLDEAPTLYIPKFEQVPATARSNKIATVYMAQDISQMVQSYGQVNADVIVGNLNNQLFGRVANQKTASYISKIFGSGEVEDISISHSSSGMGTMTRRKSKSVSHRKRETELLKAQEMMNMELGEFAGVVVGNKNESFVGKIQIKEGRVEELPAFASAEAREVQKNFERIHQEAQRILERGGSLV